MKFEPFAALLLTILLLTTFIPVNSSTQIFHDSQELSAHVVKRYLVKPTQSGDASIETEESLVKQKSKPVDPRRMFTCGAVMPNHMHIHQEMHNSPVLGVQQDRMNTCPIYTRCDKEEIRDQYIEPVNRTFFVEFIIFDDGSGFFHDAEIHLPGAVETLQRDFSPTGINLVASATIVVLSTQGHNVDQFYTGSLGCDPESDRQPCYGTMQLLNAVRAGRPRQKQTIYIITGVFQDESIGGFAFFPWQDEYHGIVAVHSEIVRPGFSTVTHEIGHYFGLVR